MRFYNSADIPANLAEESFAANLLRLNPRGKAQLFGLSGLAHTRTFSAIKHAWWTKKSKFPQVTVATGGGGAASVTTLTVNVVATNTDDNITFIIPNTILRLQKISGASVLVEHMLVTSVNHTTGELTVVRGFGGTTPMTVADADVLIAVGNAFGQGSDAPSPISILPTMYDNNTQIFRNAWGNSRTLAEIEMRAGGGATAENKLDAMFFHGAAIEEQLLFGRKDVSVDQHGAPLTTMGGLEQIIGDLAPQNISVAGATTTFDQLESMLDPLLDYQVDGSTKAELNMYVGKTALKAINQIGKLEGSYQVTQNETSFGQRFMNFRTTRGEFNLIEHPLLNANATWAKMAFIVDTAALDIMYLHKTSHDEIKGSGKDAEAGVYTTELTLELQNPFSCGVIHNLTEGAK